MFLQERTCMFINANCLLEILFKQKKEHIKSNHLELGYEQLKTFKR